MGVVHRVFVIFTRTGNKRISTPMCVYSFILGSGLFFKYTIVLHIFQLKKYD